jgi:hypothetical protein
MADLLLRNGIVTVVNYLTVIVATILTVITMVD